VVHGASEDGLIAEGMDRITVRDAAEDHVRAIVDGRIDDALTSIVEELREESAANLSLVAPLVVEASVADVSIVDDAATVVLTFVTPGADPPEVRIETEWWEIDGRPQLVRAIQM
jgi:hypothetical protein